MEKNRIQKISKIQKLLKEDPKILVSLKKKYKFDRWALNTVGQSTIYFLDLNEFKFETLYTNRVGWNSYSSKPLDVKDKSIQINCKKTFSSGSSIIPLVLFETKYEKDIAKNFLANYLIGSWPYVYLHDADKIEVKKEFERQQKIEISLNI